LKVSKTAKLPLDKIEIVKIPPQIFASHALQESTIERNTNIAPIRQSIQHAALP